MRNKGKSEGLITKVLGGLYTVETVGGTIECTARGIFRNKGISPVCGDFVSLDEDNGSYAISSISERRNLLIRPPLANLDQLVFVVSTCEPSPNFTIIDKFIAISEFKKIKPVIVITKVDLDNSNLIHLVYDKCGISVFNVDNTTGEGSEEVKKVLEGNFSAFTGNTGVGKSSLLNNIFPDLTLATNEISKKLGRGKHTTRHVELYKFGENSYVADTPGFSTFDTNRYDIILKEQLADCFCEFRPFVDKCRFADCSHTKEKGCAVIEAVNQGIISQSRHNSYVEMYEEAKQIKEWELKK